MPQIIMITLIHVLISELEVFYDIWISTFNFANMLSKSARVFACTCGNIVSPS